MQNKPYAGAVKLGAPKPSQIKRRYSVTADVVAFRKCARQYGAFKVHSYAPAFQTTLYFGTLVHQVLDRCHNHFHGLIDPAKKGCIPDGGTRLSRPAVSAWFDVVDKTRRDGSPQPTPPTEMLRYFMEAESGLRSRGIQPVSRDLRVKAAVILQNFNALEGPKLYPRVLDTEYRLQADQQSHILHGVVDLLVEHVGAGKEPQDCELWDYKGVDPLKLTKSDWETYRFQMRVYARLYQLKHGVFPKRARLYFVNMLDLDKLPSSTPANAVYDVPLGNSEVDAAEVAFKDTVDDIEAARAIDTWFPPAKSDISEQTCAICDLRWDCPTANEGTPVKMRYP
jgi:hypothetical protein